MTIISFLYEDMFFGFASDTVKLDATGLVQQETQDRKALSPEEIYRLLDESSDCMGFNK